MFLLCSQSPTPPQKAPTLNHTPPPRERPESPAERQARQLHACKRLAELGMKLAEAAAEHALIELATPDPKPTPENPTPTPTDRTKSARLFTSLSRIIRQAMMLENRIAAEQPAPAPIPASRPAASPPKPGSAIYHPVSKTDDPNEKLFDSVCRELGIAPVPPERWPKEARK